MSSITESATSLHAINQSLASLAMTSMYNPSAIFGGAARTDKGHILLAYDVNSVKKHIGTYTNHQRYAQKRSEPHTDVQVD